VEARKLSPQARPVLESTKESELIVDDSSVPNSVVVIGGTGFVGRHVCAALEDAGHRLLVIARDPSKNHARRRFVSHDLARAPANELTGLLLRESPVAVVNAAGAVWSATDRELHEGNIVLVERLLTALRELPRPPRLVHLGSVNEYAPLARDATVNETVPLRPVTTYGISKAAGSSRVLEAVTGPLRGLVLRLSNVVGPGSPPASLLGRVAGQLQEDAQCSRRPVVRLYPMRAHRDFLDYQDAARAVVRAVRSDVNGRAVNVGSGVAVPVRDLVDRLIAVSGLAAQVSETQQPSAVKRIPEAEWLRVDVSTAERVLGWSPSRSLDAAIADLWQEVIARSGAF
jgi:nucleoside-diphosphate-sugar epimerase